MEVFPTYRPSRFGSDHEVKGGSGICMSRVGVQSTVCHGMCICGLTRIASFFHSDRPRYPTGAVGCQIHSIVSPSPASGLMQAHPRETSVDETSPRSSRQAFWRALISSSAEVTVGP
jgi:hypothetical protein